MITKTNTTISTVEVTKDTPFAYAFGDCLRQWRTSYRLKQTEAAKKAGITQTQWSRFERYENIPRLDTAEKLIGVFQVNWDTFFSGPPVRRATQEITI